MPVLSTRIVLDCFYLLIFYFEKFSTDVCRLLCAVNVNLNLSNSFALNVTLSFKLRNMVRRQFVGKDHVTKPQEQLRGKLLGIGLLRSLLILVPLTFILLKDMKKMVYSKNTVRTFHYKYILRGP